MLARAVAVLALLGVGTLAACADLIHDTEKGVHTTETEVRGSNGAKSVEHGANELKKDVAGHDPADGSAGAVDAAPSSPETKI